VPDRIDLIVEGVSLSVVMRNSVEELDPVQLDGVDKVVVLHFLGYELSLYLTGLTVDAVNLVEVSLIILVHLLLSISDLLFVARQFLELCGSDVGLEIKVPPFWVNAFHLLYNYSVYIN